MPLSRWIPMLVLALGLVTQIAEGETTDHWTLSKPMEEGMEERLLKDLDEKFEKGDYGYIDGVLIVKNGKIVYERSYDHDYSRINEGRDTGYRYYNTEQFPYFGDTGLHTMQSVTKSVTSAVIGVAIENGDFPDIDARMMDSFRDEDVENLDSRKNEITIEHLLTMTPGFDWDEFSVPYNHPENDCRLMEESPDWVAYVINRPTAHTPGERFAYSSGVSQILSSIFTKTAGVPISDYARDHLFEPLGIDEFYWQTTPQGLPDTEGGLYLRARDLAKIGQLYLQEGTWQGEQVLPKTWVSKSVEPHVPDTELYGNGSQSRGFGYHWWIVPYSIGERMSRIYTALGYGGQRLFVVPDHNLVAVFTGWNIYETGSLHIRVFQSFVLKAAESHR